MDAFVIESVHNATKESNNSSYSSESFVPLSSLSDNTRLKKLKNESAVGGFWSSLRGFVGIAGALAGSTSTLSDEAKEKLLECDKELEAKLAQAQMCKKQIEDFKQQKSNLEKNLQF